MVERKTVRANQTFFAAKAKGDPGVANPVNEGDLLSASDPLVKAHPELFSPVEDVVERTRPVKKAT